MKITKNNCESWKIFITKANTWNVFQEGAHIVTEPNETWFYKCIQLFRK